HPPPDSRRSAPMYVRAPRLAPPRPDDLDGHTDDAQLRSRLRALDEPANEGGRGPAVLVRGVPRPARRLVRAPAPVAGGFVQRAHGPARLIRTRRFMEGPFPGTPAGRMRTSM